MFRFFALMWDWKAEEASAVAMDLGMKLSRTSGSWQSVYSAPGVKVFVADASQAMGAHRFHDDAGVILGEIFVRHHDVENEEPSREAVFGEQETVRALATEGRNLVSAYWGNYVAVVVSPGSRYVIKDPTGSLPCYHATHRGVGLLFSCIADCTELDCMHFPINWAYVRAKSVDGPFHVEISPLQGVTRVHPGECVIYEDRGRVVSRKFYWHPSGFEGASVMIEDPDSAARALRATVRSCVHTLAARHPRVLQQLSGGLDSSIVLGCLADAPSALDISCYTIYVPDAPSDERRWARYATHRRGHRHIEVAADLGSLLFKDRPPLAPSIEPVSSLGQWLKGPVERRLAAEFGATAVLTGDGGDPTFGSTTYVFAVDRALARYGLGLKTLSMAAQVAARRDQTVWHVLGNSLRRARHGTSMSDFRALMSKSSRLVETEVKQAAAADHFPNPWFNVGEQIPLERIWRLGPLAYAPMFYDLSTSQHGAAPLVVSPLCAQPVYEIAARIPADVHFDAGRTRGLARRAFAREVPEPILRRQWKDRPLSPVADLVRTNMAFIRDRLLDGVLVRERILNRAALELALSGGPSKSDAISGEILSHLDVELWCASHQQVVMP
jgi:asparagine synthase (glutamine-hydrolysing)